MTPKIYSIGLAILICITLCGGCNPSQKGTKAQARQLGKVEKTQTPADKKRGKLLKQIDRKFENPKAHFELGQLYQDDGLWAQAENEYRIALSFDPVYRQAQAARVKTLMASGDKTKAELLADEYISQASNSAVGSLKLALAFQKQQLDDYALACYQQALRLAPNSAKINRQIGYYYLSRNDKVRAEEYLRRSFNLDPTQADVAGELGRLGVSINLEKPRSHRENPKKLDKIVEQSNKKTKP